MDPVTIALALFAAYAVTRKPAAARTKRVPATRATVAKLSPLVASPAPGGGVLVTNDPRPGVYVIFASGSREPLTAATKTFHTILITADGINIVRDTHHDDPLRSQLILYNLTSGPLRFDAIVPSAPLFDGVAPGGADSIAINAIPVTVAAIRQPPADVDGEPPDQYEATLHLERGESYAIVVMENGPALTGFVVTATVSTGTE